MFALIILLVIAALLVFWVIGVYKRLATARKRFKNAFAQIDVQFQRRNDLIPNLVEIVKGYMKDQRETLEAVIDARNQAVTASSRARVAPADAKAVQQLVAAEGSLSASLDRMLALSESCLDLKTDQNMMQLSEELASTGNKISFARQAYNDSVMQYNADIEQFPGSVLANMLGFHAAELLYETVSTEQSEAA